MATKKACGRCGRKTNRRITMADAPPHISSVAEDTEDFQLRVWAHMAPPKISENIPIIPPERLERVRHLLDKSQVPDDDVLETHIDSCLNIQMMEDGTMRKIRSRSEIKRYPATPTLVMARSHPTKKYCRSNCEPTTEAELDLLIAGMCEKQYIEFSQNLEPTEYEEGYAEDEDNAYLEDLNSDCNY